MENLLTAKHYTHPQIFEQEQKQLFSNSWQYAGLLEDLAQDNTYFTVDIGLNSFIVLKEEGADIRAFHNICRHRGMRLLEGKGTLGKQISCPYHDWTYNRQGELKSLPKAKHEFGQINKACLSLKSAKIACWRGMIWLHPNENAEAFEVFLADFENQLAPYDVEQLISAGDAEEVIIAANWKLVVENYIDHYHLAQLHAGTLNMYEHKNAEFGFTGDHFYFWEPLTADYGANIEKNAPYPLLLDAEHPRIGAWVLMMFPCLGLVETESSWSVFHIIPLSVNSTKVVVRSKVKSCSSFAFFKQANASYQYWNNKLKGKSVDYDKSHPLGSGDFMQEDVYVCEQLQKSLQSDYFEFGPSATYGEAPIRGFQTRYLEKMKQA